MLRPSRPPPARARWPWRGPRAAGRAGAAPTAPPATCPGWWARRRPRGCRRRAEGWAGAATAAAPGPPRCWGRTAAAPPPAVREGAIGGACVGNLGRGAPGRGAQGGVASPGRLRSRRPAAAASWRGEGQGSEPPSADRPCLSSCGLHGLAELHAEAIPSADWEWAVLLGQGFMQRWPMRPPMHTGRRRRRASAPPHGAQQHRILEGG